MPIPVEVAPSGVAVMLEFAATTLPRE